MATRQSVTVILSLLTLLAVSMVLRNPTPVTAQGQRRNPGVPHQQATPPAVLALDNSGEPQLVSEANPVPVRVPTPLAITSTTPLVVNDGGLVIESRGNYTFVFPNEVKLPFMTEKVQSLEVTVTQIAGKWVTASYQGTMAGVTRPQVTYQFNTEQLLAIAPRR
jgi:hypothetical protein